MPNRILRDWTASEAINSLSPQAETLFTRLIMKADDYGRYYANPQLLNGNLFALKKYTSSQISTWLTELFDAGIIQLYRDEGKLYLEIKNFNQRLRVMKSKFATPNPANLTVPSFDSKCPPETKRRETKRNRNEDETETISTKVDLSAEADVSVWPTFDDWYNLYDKKEGRSEAIKVWKKLSHEARELAYRHSEQYIIARPDKQYRKHAARYLKEQIWNDEIIKPSIHGQQQGVTEQATRDRIAGYTIKFGKVKGT